MPQTARRWGTQRYGTTDQTLVESWDGTAWSITASPNPSGNPNSYLVGISCLSATNCTAVGNSGNTNTNSSQTLVVAGSVLPLTVSAVSPNSGPTSGGTAITITGTGFVTGATVEIGQGNGAGTGAIAATNVVVVSATQITAVTGGGAKAGTFSLFVITSAGTSAANSGDDFTYN